MAPSDVCQTEDAVQAFLEYLVDPLLPAKSSLLDSPAPSQQQLVANQVHSVVLLYNYYHRKQHPELAFLAFYEFCELAVVLKPTFLSHMKFMQMAGKIELNDVEKQLSVTEKKVMGACDICTSLDASKIFPNIEGWPISKVAVLLIDSKKENCLLLFSSITEGVWSVVEKDLDISSQSSEVTKGTRCAYKKKRVVRKPTKDELNSDESGCLQVGYSSVKEAADINQTDVVLLESYTVYSQSKEKEASRFYIMQCSQLISQEVIQVPIKDVINSLQGPLVKKSPSRWTITPVVEYFHVLPYSEIISEWLSRETFSSSLQDSRVADRNIMVDNSEGTESYENEGISNDLDSKPSSNNIESLEQKENSGNCTLRLSNYFKETQDMDVDNEDSSVFSIQNKEKCQYIANPVQVGNTQEMKIPSVQNYLNGSTSAVKVDSTGILTTEGEIKNVAACNKICVNTTSDCALVANQSNSEDIEKLRVFLASKGDILSQTALAVLIQKRNELALQQRIIEDEIAVCDKKIQTMLTVGGEDDLELKIESIIEGCNDVCVRNQERTCQHPEDQCLPPCIKRKRLSEAVLSLRSPCQELDGLCHENNWILPTYRVSHSDGGFQANVTVKGIDFECSCGGNLCFNPREARESAAAQVLAKLRSMVNSAK